METTMTVENVVLLTVDSLRADYCRAALQDGTAPTVSELADGGTVFTEAVSNGPNTASSFPSILTGTHPSMYGGYGYISEERPFLAEILRESGFDTAAYHSNPNLRAEKNFDCGFDQFNTNDSGSGRGGVNGVVDYVEQRVDANSRLYSVLRRAWHTFGSATGASAYSRADVITDNAIDWIEGCSDSPFFLWAHYMDVHYPFQPPDKDMEAAGHTPLPARRVAELNNAMEEQPESLSEEDTADLKSLYRGEIHYVDRSLRRLLDAIDNLGVRDETLLLFTSDHGEAFGEHGRWGHHPYMYDELLRVPLIVDHPNRSIDTVETQVSLIDILPTVCEACGLEQPSRAQGEHLFKKQGGVELATAGGGDRIAARTSNWKCLWHFEENTVELYDLTDDPDETTDVTDDNTDNMNRLKQSISEYRARARKTAVDHPDVSESEAVTQRLRELGYTE